MLELTFGEQVKIILSRKGMTIKELAEKIEKQTGKKMSRQNLTQRLGRDNFQEQDMRMIAKILECPFYLDILEEHEDRTEKPVKEQKAAEPEQKEAPTRAEERDITIGELVDIHKELDAIEKKKSKKKAKKVVEDPRPGRPSPQPRRHRSPRRCARDTSHRSGSRSRAPCPGWAR